MRYGISRIEYITFEQGEDVIEIDSGPNQAGWYAAFCPVHEDERPSLGIREGDAGELVVYCHAGCTVKEIIKKVRELLGESIDR